MEDAEPDHLIAIYTWIYIANLWVGLLALLARGLIGIFTLVPTMRGLYFFVALLFTLKAVITYRNTGETAQGKYRL